MAFYTAGHAAIGLPLFLIGDAWRLLTRRRLLWHPTPVDLPLATFGVILLLSTAASPYHQIAVDATFVTVLSGVVFFGAFTWLLHQAPDVRVALLRAWALGAPPAAVIGMIAGWITHERTYFPRMPMGTNAFGTTLFLGSLVALGLAYRARERERFLWFACALVSLVGLLSTESRSALAGWVTGAAYLTWRELREHPPRLAVALASGMIVLALAGIVVPTAVARVRNAPMDLVEDRVRIWRIAVGIIESHPLLGTGPGTFQVMFDQRKAPSQERKWSAHNLWFNYAVETGLLGFLSILWVVSVAVREWVRAGRRAPPGADPLRPAVTAVVIGVLVDQCGDNTLLSVSTISGFWLLLALLVVPVPRSREDS